ncbi:hypothetical protein Tco_1251663, partial [Tanacetum coccineum]
MADNAMDRGNVGRASLVRQTPSSGTIDKPFGKEMIKLKWKLYRDFLKSVTQLIISAYVRLMAVRVPPAMSPGLLRYVYSSTVKVEIYFQYRCLAYIWFRLMDLIGLAPPIYWLHLFSGTISAYVRLMAVRVLPAMSPGLSASIGEVAAMSDSAFCKRFRSFYESSPSSLPPDLPSQKRYRGTSKLVKDDEEEEDNKKEDDEEEDEEIEESSNFNSESEDAEDEGPTTKDEDPAIGDEVLATRDEGPIMGVECLNLGEDEAVPEGQQRAALVVETAVGEPLGLGYEVLRRQEIAFREGRMPSV